MKYSALINHGGDCPSLDGCQVSTPHEGRLMYFSNDKQLCDGGIVIATSGGVTPTEDENKREITG